MSNLDSVIAHTARIVSQVTEELPADAVLRSELSHNADLDPDAKHDIANAVFTYFRWLGWLATDTALPKQIAAALDLQKRFVTHPDSIKAEALSARALPGWVASEVELPVATLRQFQRPPTLWIRAQSEYNKSVPRALGQCSPAPAPAITGHAYRGTKDLHRVDEFRQGLFEIQDLASQLVGHACSPAPGETWWDACAGQGGKTLHLADLMQNKGLIWASDRNTGRLAALRKRAGRAQVFNYRAVIWNGGPFLPTKTKFDGILVDAPCSGVGTWQRNPHARWTTTIDDVRELAAIQLQLLEHVRTALKPGGRLIYSVCTLTRSETTAIADAFTAAHPELEPIPLLDRGPQVTIWPHEWDANGMFLAGWRLRT